jgi:hypothetical protein
MKISFLDYWRAPNSFNPHNNFFLHLLRQIFENVIVSDPEDADVIFSLGFGLEYTRFKDCIRIQYAGENVRPNFKFFDYSLTFDFDDYGGKNFRFPLWMMHIDWFNVGTYDNPEWLVPENYLYGENEFTIKEKTLFCSILFSKIIDSRIKGIEIISKYKPVDVFGILNQSVKIPDGEKYKMDLISNYKFSMCYENSITPGYHTEKLFQGKIAGNIPIYYGDKTIEKDFNKKCFINAAEMSNDELIETIKEIDCNTNLYKSFFNEPLFTEKISLELVTKFFIKILK